MEQILQALHRAGYTTDGPDFAIGRPDRATLPLANRAGVPVVAKLFPAGGGESTFANMQELWRSSFGERRRPPGLPRPINYLPDIRVVIMERLPGRPLIELGALDASVIAGAVPLLASLHECDAHPSRRRSSRGIVRSAKRKAERVAELAPHFASVFRELAGALEAARVEDLELVPSHGDFSPRNILVASHRLTLIDWDRFQCADPARDIASMGTWCWFWALRQGRPPDWIVLDRIVQTYTLLRPGTAIGARLRFHVAAGLMRIAHISVELWPNDAYLVPQLTAEALRHLR